MHQPEEMYPANKGELYALLKKQLAALLEGETRPLPHLCNAAALVYGALKEINWAGFYLMEKDGLLLGPFQGKPACIHIPLGKGVCGTAAAQDRAVIVGNVHLFPGHIACDSASNSEIVIPIRVNGAVAGVLDIDSPLMSRFDEQDRQGLEELMALLAAGCNWDHPGAVTLTPPQQGEKMDTREYWRAFLIAQGFAEENVMRNIRRALLVTAGLLVMLSLGLPALAVEPPRADFDLGTEAFGPLRIGLPAEELQWLLGDWKQLSEPALWAADGLEHWEAGYELLGITVGLAREPGDGTGAFVSSILATGPREWKTARGLGIGDPVEIVVSLYADAIDPLWNSDPSREILIGSLYGGMLVSLENGLVVSLYLGALAE